MHCITLAPQPTFSRTHNFKVHQVPAHKDNIVWIIEYIPGLCAIVDGPSAKEVLIYIESHSLRITHILNTHTHPDHIGINLDLQKRGLLKDIDVIGCRNRSSDIPGLTMGVGDGDLFKLGCLDVIIWLTEGHIDGHISFIIGDFLFCGDTMFSGGCGYLFDGPPSKMCASLQRLASLPIETFVCPAHEYTEDNLLFAMSIDSRNPLLVERYELVKSIRKNGASTLPSTIHIERNTNPFLRLNSRNIQDHLKSKNTNEVEIFTNIRKLKDSKLYRNSN